LKDTKDVSKVDGTLQGKSSKSQMPNKKQVRDKASSGLKLVKPKTPENGASTTSEENEAGSSQVGESKKEDEYAYDSSDEEDIRNTIGNIPTNWYDEYGHIGYDLEGKKIRKGHILERIPVLVSIYFLIQRSFGLDCILFARTALIPIPYLKPFIIC
jgi:hypothetical protein